VIGINTCVWTKIIQKVSVERSTAHVRTVFKVTARSLKSVNGILGHGIVRRKILMSAVSMIIGTAEIIPTVSGIDLITSVKKNTVQISAVRITDHARTVHNKSARMLLTIVIGIYTHGSVQTKFVVALIY